MLNPIIKSLIIKPIQKLTSSYRRQSMRDIQDEIFRKMSVDGKLSLLDEFFRFGKELQNLNDRKREQIKR